LQIAVAHDTLKRADARFATGQPASTRPEVGMRRSLGQFAVLVAGLSLGGCALNAGATGRDSRDHGVLTKEQIAENHFNTAYDAVEALRSNWLRVRGTDSFQSPSEVQVYVDDTKLGGTDTLREIAASTIYYMRFFDGVAATGRWGVGHAGGVIFVSTHAPGADPASSVPPKDTVATNDLVEADRVL
jgi:hypothetical protein